MSPSFPFPTSAATAGRIVSESKFTAELAGYAEKLGFDTYPVHQTRSKPRQNITPGHADITMFGHNTTLFVETKVGTYKQTEHQKTFEQSATKNGSLYWVVHSKEEFLVLGKIKGWWR